jgi:prepilin-type N-terminal cleavage/methylation domain-containing protein
MIDRIRTLRRESEAGFTLVEMLVTISIMAIAVIIILGAIAVFLRTSSVHRTSADLDSAMRTYVERLDQVAYVPCASSYSVPAANLPAGFLAMYEPTIAVQYWDGVPTPAGYGGTCTVATDKGAQQVTVTLRKVGDSHADSLVIVKRQA